MYHNVCIYVLFCLWHPQNIILQHRQLHFLLCWSCFGTACPQGSQPWRPHCFRGPLGGNPNRNLHQQRAWFCLPSNKREDMYHLFEFVFSCILLFPLSPKEASLSGLGAQGKNKQHGHLTSTSVSLPYLFLSAPLHQDLQENKSLLCLLNHYLLVHLPDNPQATCWGCLHLWACV